MQNTYLKILISVVAIAILIIRLINPNIKVDSTLLILLGIATLPWLSSLIKSVELPGGLKIEFQDNEPKVQVPKDVKSEMPTKVQQGRRKNQSTKETTSALLEIDTYFDRLLKLTPIETIAAFVVLNTIVKKTIVGLSPLLVTAITWLVFALLVVLTPIWLWKQGVNIFSQLIVSTVGFVIWVFALGGPFSLLGWYDPLYGALLLVVYMAITPFFITALSR